MMKQLWAITSRLAENKDQFQDDDLVKVKAQFLAIAGALLEEVLLFDTA